MYYSTGTRTQTILEDPFLGSPDGMKTPFVSNEIHMDFEQLRLKRNIIELY